MNSLRDILTKCIINCNFLITETEVNNFVEKILLTSSIHYQNDGSELKLEGGDNDIGIPKEKWDLALKMPKYLAFSMSNLDPLTFTRYCKLIGYTSFSDMEYDLVRGCISGFEPNPYEIILINGNVQAGISQLDALAQFKTSITYRLLQNSESKLYFEVFEYLLCMYNCEIRGDW